MERTTVLKDLQPETEYVVNVFSVVEDESSEPLIGRETTCKLEMSLEQHVYCQFGTWGAVQ